MVEDNTSQAGEGLSIKCDWYIIFASLKQHWYYFCGIFAILLLLGSIVSYRSLKYSDERWSASTKLFHQTLSERVPSFYKPIDTKVIAELISSQTQIIAAASKLKLDPKQKLPSVQVEIMKNKPNIIAISGKGMEKELTVKFVNAVAECGVEAYVNLQSSTISGIVNERKYRYHLLNNELTELEESLHKFVSKESFLAPDAELTRLRDSMTINLQLQHDDQNELDKSINILKEANAEYKKTDRDVRYSHTIHASESAALSKMKGDLTALLHVYTEENPKVIALKTEIATKEAIMNEQSKGEQPPSEIVYTINQISIKLEGIIMDTKMQIAGIQKRMENRQKQIDKLHSQLQVQINAISEYNAIQRKIEATKVNIEQLGTTINSMELLLNTAVPDLSVIEIAVPTSNVMNSLLKYIVITVFVAGIVLVMVVVGFIQIEIYFGNVKSSKELSLWGNIDDLGNILSEKSGHSLYEAALNNAFEKLRAAFGEKKILLYSRLSESSTEHVLNSFMERFGVQGNRIFQVKLDNIARRDNDAKVEDSDFICIEKIMGKGYFYYANSDGIVNTDLQLLQVDLSTLQENYDIIIFEMNEKISDCNVLFKQFATIADYTVVETKFNKVKKFKTSWLNSEKSLAIGGIVEDVPYKYWRKR